MFQSIERILTKYMFQIFDLDSWYDVVFVIELGGEESQARSTQITLIP